jgi:hypothetical protein
VAKRQPPKEAHVEIIALEWVDAVYNRDVFTSLHPIPLLTFGYLFAETEDFYTVAFELHASNEPKHLISVPKGQMWPKVHHVGYIKEPKSFEKYRQTETYANN